MTRVLVVSPIPKDGTSYYRSWGPYSRIKSIELGRPDGGELDWSVLAPYDIGLWQRPGNQLDVVSMMVAKKSGLKLILDADDNGFSVPSDNPAADFYEQEDKKACMRECMRLADIITVSTPELKKALLKQVPTADIRVVPNAVDDYMFSTEPSFHERNKTILIRGASGHTNDYLHYKDAILQILREHPDYTLAVCGYHPMWLTEIPDNQLKLYQFVDIPTYFEQLMQIRPEVMIVPLIDNEFNRAKSNISYLEGTLAGATVIAPNLPEFVRPGCVLINGPEDLVPTFNELIESQDARRYYLRYKRAITNLPKLSEINELRRDIIEELLTLDKKWKPLNPPKQTATEQEFHEHNLAYGHNQADPQYQAFHSKAVDNLIKLINPQTVVEYGCGSGGTLAEFLKRGVVAHGIEYSPIAVKYFKDHHPLFANQIIEADITKEPIDLDKPADLGVSIEVFEHINMPPEWWDTFISGLSERFKYFYFTSTPYYTTEQHDFWWGHSNIRKTSTWIKLFEKNGWIYESNPKFLVGWDLIFRSKLNS